MIQHAFDLLESSGEAEPPGLVALVGDDRFLKSQVLRHLEGTDPDDAFDRLSNRLEWRDVIDELSTVSLFSSRPRRAVMFDADEFVTRCRPQLEVLAQQPQSNATLFLDLRSLPANTKLYKQASQSGWIIECRAPQTARGKSKQLDVRRLNQWLSAWAKQQHGIRLAKDAHELLVELTNWDFGRLDQELAKLALFVERSEDVSARLVQDVVGGWRAKTTWEMLDAAADGDIASALRQLDQLLQSGEAPQMLFGSTAWSLRRFADATRIFELRMREGERPELPEVLADAGFRKWPPEQLKNSERQLKRIGRHKCSQLYSRLLETDLSLKGTHSAPHRARWAIEYLLLGLTKS